MRLADKVAIVNGVNVRPPERTDGWLDWTLDKAVELGLSPVYTTVLHLRDERDAGDYRRKLEERGLQLIGSGGGGFATVGDEWRHVPAQISHQPRLTPPRPWGRHRRRPHPTPPA